MTMENLLTELTEIYANIYLGWHVLFLQLTKSWNLFLGNVIHSPSENQMEWIFKEKFLNNFIVSDGGWSTLIIVINTLMLRIFNLIWWYLFFFGEPKIRIVHHLGRKMMNKREPLSSWISQNKWISFQVFY